MPDPKKCPKCDGIMYWVGLTKYVCQGSSSSFGSACGYKEEISNQE